jgi:hypothetical protein
MKEYWKKYKDYIFVIFAIVCFVIIGYLMEYTALGKISAGGGNIKVMDGLFHYNYTYVKETLGLLGSSGRAEYTTFHILDYFFLVSYCLVMISITKPIVSKKVKWISIAIPLLPATADIIENTLIEIASSNYPSISDSFCKTISIFTTIKWSLGLLWFVMYCVLIIICLIRYIKNKKR